MEERLREHLSGDNELSFTKRARDWFIYFRIDNVNYSESREIEKHIKRMKSRKYIEDMVKYPDIIERLRKKYCAGSFR